MLQHFNQYKSPHFVKRKSGNLCDKEVTEKIKESYPKAEKSGACMMYLKCMQFLISPFQSHPNL